MAEACARALGFEPLMVIAIEQEQNGNFVQAVLALMAASSLSRKGLRPSGERSELLMRAQQLLECKGENDRAMNILECLVLNDLTSVGGITSRLVARFQTLVNS